MTKTLLMCRFSVASLFLVFGIICFAESVAAELEAQRDGLVDETNITTPDFSGESFTTVQWQKEIRKVGAGYLRLHFSEVIVPSGREIVLQLRDRGGHGVHEYTTEDLASRPAFWSVVIPGDYVLLSLFSDKSPAGLSFKIDKIAYQAYAGAPLSTVGNDDKQPIAEYQNTTVIVVAQRPVARLLFMKSGVPSVCTGFLIGDSQLITNHHCVDEQSVCESTVAVFGYQYDENGLLNFGEQFECEKVKGSDTNYELDYAILQLRNKPGIKWGQLEFSSLDPGENQGLFIIQHPAGLPKQISKIECVAKNIPVDGRAQETDFTHTCDTLGGSSGSPVFNEMGQIVGIHHYGFGEGGEWIENRAVRSIKILASMPQP